MRCSFSNSSMTKFGAVKSEKKNFNFFFLGQYTNYTAFYPMDYNQSITANKSAFVPDDLNYYGNNSISYDTSCFFNLNGSTPSQMGEVY